MTETGLRERKKRDTRRALSDAALQLMFEKGLANVRREDIAARAGVSVRTFNNYFDGLPDAVAYRYVERLQRGVELLRARPPNEPLWTALTTAIVAPYEQDITESFRPTGSQRAQIAALLTIPQVQAAVSKGAFEQFVAAIADRTGTDPQTDLYPRLVAGAVEAAHRTAFHLHAHSTTPMHVTTRLRDALALLAEGLPDPSR